VSVFFRIFRTFWFLILLGSLLIMLVLPISREPRMVLFERPRELPIAKIQECAALAVQKSAQGFHGGQGPECFNGYLLTSNGSGAAMGGVRLPYGESELLEWARNRISPMVMATIDETVVAVRTDPAVNTSPLYVARLPYPGTRRAKTKFGFAMLLRFIAFSAIAALVLSLYFTRPITLLSEATQAFGTGDLRVRLKPALTKRRDEIGRVSRGFNEMAERIESLVLQQKTFLAHAAHELGSPLTRLNIALALCKRRLDSTKAPELKRIEDESEQLNALVQQLLLFARLESGNEMDQNRTSFFVSRVLTAAVENARFEGEHQGKMVTFAREEPFAIEGYPDLLQRAFDNVLRNALRFARVITVESRVDDARDVGLVDIYDDGPGIPEGMEETIFEPFQRVSDSDGSAETKGAGLGLAIARQTVLANGGTISAHKSPMGGLMVRYEFPLRRGN